MSEHVYLAVYDTLADWEAGHATAHIANSQWQRSPGRYRLRTVGPTPAPVRTMGGMQIVPDCTLEEVDPADTAMLILPGAEAWIDGGNGDFVAKAAEVLAAGGGVAAICGATAGLARAGLLDDRWHTSNAREFLRMTGYRGEHRYRDEPAVRDGNLVTASGTAPAAFAREIFAVLDLYEPAVLASWFKLYGANDPAGFYELMEAGAR